MSVRGRIDALGAVLFRHRDWTPVPLAVWLIVKARPRLRDMAVAGVLIAAGLALRLWAVAYIGPASRTRDGAAPPCRVVDGPYRTLLHPLYLGNGILSQGLVLASGAGRRWMPYVMPLLMLAQYGPIIAWEETALRGAKRARPGSTPDYPTALSSERRTYQAVGAFLVAICVSGFRRHLAERKDARLALGR